MSWQNDMEKDLNEVFFQEFAAPHTVEGKQVTCIIDTDEAKTRAPEYDLGQADFVLRLRKSDGIKRKSAGAYLNLDGREFMIVSWVEQDGEHIVALTAAELA